MYDPQRYNSDYTVSGSGTRVSFVSVMKNVYLWMTLALAITGITAMAVATQPQLVEAIFTNKLFFWGLIGAELGIVWFVSSRIMSLSVTTSGILFAIYALLNGIFFSSIFLVFEIGSIAQTFFITADSDTGLRISLLGSLTLYLDFINLFLYLLRIFGRRR